MEERKPTATRYALIDAVKGGVAFSDPGYGKDVWCQYRRPFRARVWLLQMHTARDADGLIDISLALGRKTFMSGFALTDGGAQIHFPAWYDCETKEIGIDTAKVFVGSLENFERFGEEASICTAADGKFGELDVFTAKGDKDPGGFCLTAAVDGDIADEDDLFRTVVSSFDGEEIGQDLYNRLTDRGDRFLKTLLTNEIEKAQAAENGRPSPERPRRPDEHER